MNNTPEKDKKIIKRKGGAQVDGLDKKILAHLVENSKMMSKQLSRKLHIHPNTLLQRLKRMEHDGVIVKYTTVVDYKKAMPSLQAIIFLNVNMIPNWEEVLKPVSKFPEIVSFILITGQYDAVVIARLRNELHLASLLRRLQENSVITKTTTHLILDYYKHDYEYNPMKEELKF